MSEFVTSVIHLAQPEVPKVKYLRSYSQMYMIPTLPYALNSLKLRLHFLLLIGKKENIFRLVSQEEQKQNYKEIQEDQRRFRRGDSGGPITWLLVHLFFSYYQS